MAQYIQDVGNGSESNTSIQYAKTASRLGTSSADSAAYGVGGTTVPVYFENGIPKKCVENFATQDWVSGKKYATQLWVTNQGYITAADLSGYALKTDLPDMNQYALKTDIPNMENYVPMETYNALVLRVKALEDAASSGGETTEPDEGT